MRIPRLMPFAVAALALALAKSSPAACPFCPTMQPTLGERVARSDIVVLAAWVATTKAQGDFPGTATFDVLQAAKAQPPVKPGGRVTLPVPVPGEAGALFLLTGRMGEVIEWDDPDRVTETRYQYLVQAPSPEAAAGKRLGYYLKFLEFSDPVIADDAYFEFAKAPYEDVAALAPRMPREKLRVWVADPEIPRHRLGLYGLMLGLCGTAEDAPVLERRVFEDEEDARLGIDGVMAGYLLLEGPVGLARLDRDVLQNRAAPDGDVYAAVQALRFLGQYGGGGIEKSRVCESMRLLLDRPALAEFSIRDLARWKDWSPVERVAALYDSSELNTPGRRRGVRLAVLGYLVACGRDSDSGRFGEVARESLERFRERDPKLVGEAERLIGRK